MGNGRQWRGSVPWAINGNGHVRLNGVQKVVRSNRTAPTNFPFNRMSTNWNELRDRYSPPSLES